jgi:hypothetical protein
VALRCCPELFFCEGEIMKEPLNPADMYTEAAVWLCENRMTRFKTRINGALAQILKKYPEDYKLRLLSVREAPHVDPA